MLVYGGALATAAQDYALVATLHDSTVSIYETPSTQSQHTEYAHAIHQFALDPVFAPKTKTVAFSPKSSFYRPRILFASTTTVHIYSAIPDTPLFHATIRNAASPSASLQSAAFLTADEVLLVPELAPRITIRNIITGLGIELRDVKHTSAIAALNGKMKARTHPYSIREKSGHVAFLTRPSVGKDMVVILAPPKDPSEEQSTGTRSVEVEFSLPTSDALGLRFSPDGAWLAVWDTASAVINDDAAGGVGYPVSIYTPTGRLYKQWKSSELSQDTDLDLGVAMVDWTFDGRLVIATVDGRLVILAARTFEEQAIISHSTSFEQPTTSASICVEQIAPDNGIRSYAPAVLPAAPPTQANNNSLGAEVSPRGITHLASSSDGSFLASVAAHTPTTVHVTCLSGSCMTSRAVLIHHSPVKSIEWHPTNPTWLLIRTIQEKSTSIDIVYTWSDNLPEPMVIRALMPQAVAKTLQQAKSFGSSAAGNNVSTSWIIPSGGNHPDAIPDILFSFQSAAICLSALPVENAETDNTTMPISFVEEMPTPTPLPAQSTHRLTQKTPIRGHGPEDAFDQSFEQLRAESLAQSISESVTDGGFSPVKFDVTDWTRRQVLGDPGEEQDDTFVGKARKG